MFFVKYLRFGIAYSLLAGLSGCINQPSQEIFNRTEAMQARANLALAYLADADFAKAKENIDKALAHDNQHYLPYSILAYYHQQQDHHELAEQYYQQALALSRKQREDRQPAPDVANNYGTFLCQQGKWAQAKQQFESALGASTSYYHQAETEQNLVLCQPQSR